VELAERFVAIPFKPAPERAAIVSHMMRSLCGFETIFSDYNRACEKRCFECDECLRALVAASAVLADPRALIFEVWDTSDEEQALPAGMVLFIETVPGIELEGHYAFFDGQLKNKTAFLNELVEHVIEQTGVRRLVVHVPDYAFALARHAHKHLGFGGDFVYRDTRGRAVDVEGVRKGVIRWRGQWRSILQLARVRALEVA
jgi:hypothetical protein